MEKNAETKKSLSALTLVGIVIAACLFYALNCGIRANYGLIRGAISAASGVDYEAMSLILAVAQLSFGIMQPVFGVLALKKSNGFVLCCGAALAAAGLLGIPFCQGELSLLLCLGLIMPSGLGGLSFGVIMGAVTPLLGERRAATASGIVSASNGLGNIIMAPVLRGMLDSVGLFGAILALCIPAVCLIPLALWFQKFRAPETAQPEERPTLKALLSAAFKSRSYIFLVLAFFTCGFHMAIIETHLYTEFTSYGISEQSVTYAFSVYGITTMLGSVVSGVLGSRLPMKRVLSGFFAARPVLIIGFLLLPKTLASAFVFAALLGFTGSATVPPTSGLIGKLFGPAALGTLFGLAFLAHQVGSFFSAWLGGLCVAATGGYVLIWCVDAALCVLAAVLVFSIKDLNIN